MGRLRALARPPVALTLAYALLALAWAVCNAPFSAPDEAEHYVRAIGVAHGTLDGRPARDPNPALTAKQRAWTDQASRAIAVPAGLSPAGLGCVDSFPGSSAACQYAVARAPARVEVTSVGTYQPLPYLLPALALRPAGSATTAIRLARLGGLIPWIALLAGAIAATWDRRRGARSLAGLALATTPMVIFVGASLTGSGLEIVASLALMCALLAITRAEGDEVGQPAPVWCWALAAAAGALLALSRTPAPVWVAADLVLWWAFAGRERIARAVRSRPRPALAAAGALVGAIALNRAWEGAHGPHVTTSVLPSAGALRGGVDQVADSLTQLAGRFGYLDVRPPHWVPILWAVAAAALLFVALRAARARERLALALAALLCVAGPAYLFAAVTTHTGFGLQGRHYLALVVVLALLAGETAARAAVSRRALGAFGAALAAAQLGAWWCNARRDAVGSGGPLWFPAHFAWAPPLGWAPWLAVIALACALIVVAFSAGPMRHKPVRRSPSPLS